MLLGTESKLAPNMLYHLAHSLNSEFPQAMRLSCLDVQLLVHLREVPRA